MYDFSPGTCAPTPDEQTANPRPISTSYIEPDYGEMAKGLGMVGAGYLLAGPLGAVAGALAAFRFTRWSP